MSALPPKADIAVRARERRSKGIYSREMVYCIPYRGVIQRPMEANAYESWQFQKMTH